jgi:hypothetical protein
MIERRAEIRAVLNIDGMILADEHRSMPCTISDRSATGIRVTLPSAGDLPDTFILTVEDTGEALVCRAAWRTADQIGCIADVLMIEWRVVPTSARVPAWI